MCVLQVVLSDKFSFIAVSVFVVYLETIQNCDYTELYILVTGRDSQYCTPVTVLLFIVMLLTCLILSATAKCFALIFMGGWQPLPK